MPASELPRRVPIGRPRYLTALGGMIAALTAVPPLIAAAPAMAAAPAPVTIRASDAVVVHGAFYAAVRPKALILLFHQAGSSKAEYAAIASRLVEQGYSALAIDQRSGGDLYGPNLTAAALAHPASYLDARKDLEAALAWAEQRKLPIVLWGSSYSAALVFLVAADHPEVKAVIAFSPGEYLGSPRLVSSAAHRLHMPIYVTSASDPKEEAAAATIVGAASSAVKERYVPAIGVHGSSTLIEGKDPRGAAANWQSVTRFLRVLLGS